MGALFAKLLGAFWSKNMEVAIIGLQNAGKTTLVNVLADGVSPDTIPTIGLNVKLVKRDNVTMKCWDLAGQTSYRSEWARHAATCDVLLFVVDAADRERIGEARIELHRLLEHRELEGKPLCVVANKIDLAEHLSEQEVIEGLNLDYIMDCPWVVVPLSAKERTNVQSVLEWLIQSAS